MSSDAARTEKHQVPAAMPSFDDPLSKKARKINLVVCVLGEGRGWTFSSLYFLVVHLFSQLPYLVTMCETQHADPAKC